MDQLVSQEYKKYPTTVQEYFAITSKGNTRGFPYQEPCIIYLCSLILNCNQISERNAVLGLRGEVLAAGQGAAGRPL